MTRAKRSSPEPRDRDVRREAYRVMGDLMAAVADRAPIGDLELLLRFDAFDEDTAGLLHLLGVAARVAVEEMEQSLPDDQPDSGS